MRRLQDEEKMGDEEGLILVPADWAQGDDA